MLPKLINILCNIAVAHFACSEIFMCMSLIIWWYEILFQIIYRHAECNFVVIIALRVIPRACSIRIPHFCKKCLYVFIFDTCEFEIGFTCKNKLPYSFTIMLTSEELYWWHLHSIGHQSVGLFCKDLLVGLLHTILQFWNFWNKLVIY